MAVLDKPYIRLGSADGGTLYLQKGKFWSEGGEEITDPPEWALEAAGQLSDQAKKSVGYKQGDGEADAPATPEEQRRLETARKVEDLNRRVADGEDRDTVQEELGLSDEDVEAAEQGQG